MADVVAHLIILPETEESHERKPGRYSERVLYECECRRLWTPTVGHEHRTDML